MTIHDVELTEKEILDAVAAAACGKLGLAGEHRVEIKFYGIGSLRVIGAVCKVTPLDPGSTGKPVRYIFVGEPTENPKSGT